MGRGVPSGGRGESEVDSVNGKTIWAVRAFPFLAFNGMSDDSWRLVESND